MINEQIVQHKNSIRAICVENGIALNKKQTYQLFKPGSDVSIIEEFNLSDASRFCILTSLSIIRHLSDQKEKLKLEILKQGAFFEREIKLCISIKGITPFLVLAFLADVGDLKRFKNVKGFNAYLGVVPKVTSSGDKTQIGHITRRSRKLARTMFTQRYIILHTPQPPCLIFTIL